MSASSKNNKFLSLRELHLTPHFIYMVDQPQLSTQKQYGLQIWKGEIKIGKTTDMTKKDANEEKKYASLQFNKIRLVFDVEALFEQSPQAAITLKLTQKASPQQNQVIRDEFHLHILYYSYQFSNDRFVRHKENSIGKLSNCIFNYSFSALYGERLESLLFRKHQKRDVLLQDLNLTKKDSKYGLLINDQKKKDFDTIFIIEAVAQKSTFEMPSPTVNPQKMQKMQTTNIEDQQELQDIRNAARSTVDDVAVIKLSDSNITQKDAIQQMRLKAQTFINILFVLFGCVLILSLMQPNLKI